MNTAKVFGLIDEWIKEKVHSAKKDGVVIGVSGGIDSAVCLAMASIALNSERVHAIIMPCHHYIDEKLVSGGIDSAVCLAMARIALNSERVHAIIMPCHHYIDEKLVSDEHFSDALDVVNTCGDIDYSTIWINEIYDSFYNTGLLWNNVTKENTMSRIRMILLRAYANEHNYLVMGTGNLSELMVGYCTRGGDAECDIFPLLSLTKGQVYEMGRYINKFSPIIPEKIFTKEPSAGLAPGQTDESDLGLRYEVLDKLVMKNKYGVPADDVSEEDVRRFNKLYENSSHKRQGIQSPVISGADLVPEFGKR